MERPRSMYTHKHPAGDGSHPGNIYLLLVTQRGSQPLIWPSAIFLCIFFSFFFFAFLRGRGEGGGRRGRGTDGGDGGTRLERLGEGGGRWEDKRERQASSGACARALNVRVRWRGRAA